MPALTPLVLPSGLRRRLRGGALALAVLALFAALLAPAASAQSRSIGTVVIANGWSSADSAVASALAALESDSQSDAVVLYARSDELTTRTASFIRDRQPSAVILVGGTAALSAAVHDEVVALVGGAAVRRIEGTDRFDTAAKAVPSNATTFIVANGRSAADTGVAAALAATRSNAAVLLAEADSLTEPTERIISERQPLQVEFVGGTVVLAASLADRVRELAPSVTSVPRHAGASRTDTAAAAAPNLSTTLVIANGWSPADMGIAAAYAAITTGGAVLYSQTNSLTAPTEQRIEELRPRAIVLVGGNAALDPSLHARLRTLAPTAALHRISGSDRIDTSVRAASGTLTAIGTDPPTAPTSLTATSRNLSLAVSWRAPTSTVGAAVSGYVVEYRTCTATPATCTSSPTWGGWTAHAHSGTGTSTTISGLTNDTAYQVRVRARNIFGLGPWSQIVSGIPMVQTGRPSVPASLRVEAANEQLKVTWAPSTPPSGGTLDGYDVEYRTCGSSLTCGNWTPHSHQGTGTTTTITRLSNGVKHEVRVRSRSGGSQSAWSPTASATPEQLPSFERAPDLTAGDRQILVQWNEPGYSGSAITDYDVQYRACTATDGNTAVRTCEPAADATWGGWRARSHSGTGKVVTITGLVNGTAYEVQVRARNANGVGPWSTAKKATPVSVPARPSTPTLEAGHQSLVVTWVAPADNGMPITGYDVEYCTGTCPATSTTDWIDAGDTGTDTRHEITGLNNDTAYKVRVRAINDLGGTGQGEGPWSASRTGTPKALPDAPSVSTLVAGERQITVTWTEPGANGTTINGYHVQFRACTATPRDCSTNPRWGGWSTRTHTDIANRELTITNLTNATAYEVRVRARTSTNTFGPYSAAGESTPLGKPAKPATPTLTPGNETLVVTWKAPADNGAAITSYQVASCVSTADCSLDGDWTDPPIDVTGDPLPTTETIRSLNNGTTYRVRVRAVNSVGNGPWSSSASGTPSLRPDAPAQPSINPGDRKFSLSWNEPSGNGLAISQYIVAYRACTATDGDTSVRTCAAGTTPTWGNWAERTYGATSTAATITSLTNGTKYEARVRARNANGVGPWSPSASTTPLAAPSTPTGLTLERGHTQLVVSWTASAARGSTITGYTVEYRDCTATRKDCTSSPRWNATWTPQAVTDGTTTTTITSLTNDTAYQVRVRADSATGNSGWSSTKSAIPAAVPAAPVVGTPEPDDRQLRVTWAEPDDRDSTIEHYEVAYRACTATNGDTTVKTCDSNPTWGNWRLHGDTGASLSRIITGLTNGTAYQVRARAQNEKGWGSWSETPAVGTPVGAPSAPTTPRVTTGNLELTVNWIVPRSNGSVIDGYDVRYRACEATNGDATVLTCTSNPTWAAAWETHTHSGTGTSTTIGSLVNGTAYQVRVRATAGLRESPWSEAATGMPRGTPDAPTMTLASGNRQLIVTWPRPNARGSTITSLQLRYCDNTDATKDCTSDYDDWTTRTGIGSTSTRYTISGLTNGNSHLVEMRTLSRSHGDSAWTSQETGTPGGPNPPSTPRVTAGNAQITVTWTAPARNHSDIVEYEVDYCNDTDEDCTALGAGWATNTAVSHTTLTDLEVVLSSLTNGDSYKVRVRARNTEGWGAWSSMATARPTSA
ncbi:fibronectin type III domain-containing protein [Candidatus Poriferisodalis sp.]|uniref:fibronectin type III domain-containing protein n=1 Tax=Candidatus Poriferisodalis sp. TaxID=3101277 RepID=UPI003B025672